MTQLTADTAIRMIRLTSERLRVAATELSRIDAVAGDGDHGVNMAAAFSAAEAGIAARRPTNAAEVFLLTGRACSDSGGSAGALFSAFFETLGHRLAVAAPGITDLVDGLELASRQVAVVGRAQAGDKTMLDALQPAVDAARSIDRSVDEAAVVLREAAAAAERGAAASAAMPAAAGRARYATNRAIGTRDPGAVTIAIMLGAWADASSIATYKARP